MKRINPDYQALKSFLLLSGKTFYFPENAKKRGSQPPLVEQEVEQMGVPNISTLKERFSQPRLTLVRDVFIFVAFTGLAFIDVQQLAPNSA